MILWSLMNRNTCKAAITPRMPSKRPLPAGNQGGYPFRWVEWNCFGQEEWQICSPSRRLLPHSPRIWFLGQTSLSLGDHRLSATHGIIQFPLHRSIIPIVKYIELNHRLEAAREPFCRKFVTVVVDRFLILIHLSLVRILCVRVMVLERYIFDPGVTKTEVVKTTSLPQSVLMKNML